MKYNYFIEILKKINWSQIKSKDNNCSFIIEKFTTLNRRSNELWDYEPYLINDGQLYEGTFYLLPFLLNALDFQDVNSKKIYNTIFEILNGTSNYETNVSYSEVLGEDFEYFLPSLESKKIPLNVACRTYLSLNILVFIGRAKKDTPNLKEILDIICSFYEYSNFVINQLINLYNENNGNQKELIEEYLIDFVTTDDFYDINYIKGKLN